MMCVWVTRGKILEGNLCSFSMKDLTSVVESDQFYSWIDRLKLRKFPCL